MSFLDNRSMKRDRRKRNINAAGGLYDTINFILGIGVIVSAFVIFIDHEKYDEFFTAVFLLSSLMNFCMGIKYFKRHEMLKMTILLIAGVFLLGMTILTLLALW